MREYGKQMMKHWSSTLRASRLVRLGIVLLLLSSIALGSAPLSAAPLTSSSTERVTSSRVVVGPLPGSSPNFYKVAVTSTGMHAITYEALAAAGLPVTTLDATTFQLFEQGGEIARSVVDADHGGTFNAGDYILFYGRAVNTDFTGTNFYWLTFSFGPGMEMGQRNATPQAGLPPVTTFVETLHVEQNLSWLKSLPLTGETDRWYWLLYQTRCSTNPPTPGRFTDTINTLGVATGVYSATLTPRLRGSNLVLHNAIFDMNGTVFGQATFSNQDEYKGQLKFDQSLLREGSNTLRLTAPCPGSTPAPPGTGAWSIGINWHITETMSRQTEPNSPSL